MAKKKVVNGRHFEEHIYAPANETFIGEWTKYGQDVGWGASARQLLHCNSCMEDRTKRGLNRTKSKKIRSYQVKGWTNENDLWVWEYGRCDNKQCWGPYERTITFHRVANRMQIASYKLLNGSSNPPERVDTLFFTLSQLTTGVYSGMACPVSLARMFWPLFKDLTNKQKMHVYMKMSPKKILPEELTTLEPKEFPSHYKHPDYKYPHSLAYRVFKEVPNEKHRKLPTTMRELEDSGWPEIARIFGFMYPGGAGLRFEYYRYMEGPKPSERRETQDLPSWWPGNGYAAFIRDYQGGWAGPIISYWRRKNVNNGYFS
jgi:hypothetical protein